jgi:hypothetical protein
MLIMAPRILHMIVRRSDEFHAREHQPAVTEVIGKAELCPAQRFQRFPLQTYGSVVPTLAKDVSSLMTCFTNCPGTSFTLPRWFDRPGETGGTLPIRIAR